MTEKSELKLDLPEGVPPLTLLYLYVSGSCNLACRHCWITPTFQKGTGNDNGQHIKLSYVKKAIQEARPLGLRSVKLTGGEPTIHPHFRDIVNMITDEEFRIVIETNGMLFEKKLAQFLKEKSPNAFISVSVDGAAAEIHESLRGVKGSYQKTLAGIRNLVDVGFHPQLICTLHKGNVHQVEEVVALGEKLECGSVKFNLLQQIGRGEEFSRDNGLQPTEILELYRRLEKELIPQSYVPIHFDIPFAFHPISRLLRSSSGRCSIINILGILSGGELSICGIAVTVPELIFGHMEESDLRQVWCESSGLIRLREQILGQLEGICSYCLHRDICLGCCVANNFYTAGKLNAPYSFCTHAETLGLFPGSRKI